MTSTLKPVPKFPVLIITYNRADTFARLLDSVANDGYRHIYVFCDGPRSEHDRLQQKLIVEHLTGYQQVRFRQSPVNLGCKEAVESGIDWVLGHHSGAIILEDDLLPHSDFLAYCDENLTKFEHDPRIQQVSGSNVLGGASAAFYRHRLIFSPVPNVTGWATWRTRWENYRDEARLGNIFLQPEPPEIWKRYRLKRRWEEIRGGAARSMEGRLDSWAYPWAAWGVRHHFGTVVPPVNLIEHHGLDDRATHTSEGRFIRVSDVPVRSSVSAFRRLDFSYEKLGAMLDSAWWLWRHHPQIIREKLRQFRSRTE